MHVYGDETHSIVPSLCEAGCPSDGGLYKPLSAASFLNWLNDASCELDRWFKWPDGKPSPVDPPSDMITPVSLITRYERPDVDRRRFYQDLWTTGRWTIGAMTPAEPAKLIDLGTWSIGQAEAELGGARPTDGPGARSGTHNRGTTDKSHHGHK